MIYDKRRALIEYVIFYSTPSTRTSTNVVQRDGLVADARHSEQHEPALMGGEFARHESRSSQVDTDDGCSRSSSPVSSTSSPVSGRSSPNADSDSVIDDVVPVTYEQVSRVNAVRQRTKPTSTQPGWQSSQSVNGCVLVNMQKCSH